MRRGYPEPRGPEAYDDRRYYSKNEIIAAGHGFFGSISQGLASVIEHAFKKAGRPNGYILGEDAGGAFVAGLRYGEGRLYTKDAGSHKVYWQGPSVGYDFGGAGAKAMILVYNLRDPSDVYHRFGGVEGSAYLVGGVSIQFQKHGDVVMAPIRGGNWTTARCQRRLFEVYPQTYLEPVLSGAGTGGRQGFRKWQGKIGGVGAKSRRCQGG